MKDTKRAERRRNKKRLFKRLYKQELGGNSWGVQTPEEEERHRKWAERRAQRRVTTNVPCSCWMCASERKLYGNSRQARTFQERRAIDSMKEDLVEIST